MTLAPSSASVRVRQQPRRGRYDRPAVDAALDAGLFAHVAFVYDGAPVCIPMLHARIGDTLYIHGSSASRAMRTLSGSVPACVTVTTLEGLVLARSAFEHSANYRSVMLFGRFAPVPPDERLAALEAFTNKLVAGRWQDVRKPSERELRLTVVLALPIEAASVKARSGPPDDDDSPDASLDVWAGVIPVRTSYGPPEPAPGLGDGIPLADSVKGLVGGGR